MCGSFWRVWLYLRFLTDQAQLRRTLWRAEYNTTQRSLTGSDKTALALLATRRQIKLTLALPETGAILCGIFVNAVMALATALKCRVQLVRR